MNILLIKDFKDSLTKLTGLKNDWKKQRKAAQINIELTGYTINWWSIGYKVINKTFSTFQPSSPFGKQISKENYTSHAVSIEWNNSEWSNQPGESHYLQIGVDGFLNDNKDELKRLEITETNEYGSSPNLRTTTKKYFSYQGEYIKDLLGARIHADYFKFFFQENYCAFHVYPEIIYQKTEKPLYNVGVGFMYSFKDKKDEKEKALINAELYFNLKDLSNIGNSGKSLFERNEVGIRFGLPLKFFNN